MRHLIITLLFLSFLFSSDNNQEQNITFITDPADPFIIGKLGDVPTRGIAIDIINRVFEDIDGYKPEHAPITIWKRTLKLVENGQIDAVSAILKNKQREEKYYFTKKMISAKTVFFYKKSTYNQIDWLEPKDLEKYTICTVKGYNVEKYLNDLKTEHNANIDIYTVDEFGKCFKLLLKNRVDLYAENFHTGMAYLKKQKLADNFETMNKSVYEKSFYLAFSKKSEAYKLIPQINTILEKLHEDGTIKTIESKY